MKHRFITLCALIIAIATFGCSKYAYEHQKKNTNEPLCITIKSQTANSNIYITIDDVTVNLETLKNLLDNKTSIKTNIDKEISPIFGTW